MILFQEEARGSGCGGDDGGPSADGGGGALMRLAEPQDSPFGLLPEPVVILHSVKNSE